MDGRGLAAKIHEREIFHSATKRYRPLYSDPSFINDLDIVNELDGHSGCVNALSWSRSGSLLASGSDDQHLNIHSYQPSDDINQFRLTTTVATGHTQNIFSVKFMPHHNDRIVITAAGDGEVRIFDLEYSGQAQQASNASSVAQEGRRRGRSSIYDNVRYLSDGDTNSKVYRSHGDRVKRIVTESSPHLFLTCSEDGEVRQWDLRQPSSAYPSPNDSHFGFHRSRSSREGSDLPPPLISYKRYGLDLNTISCSGSQPYYIALGGAHIHAFLHDRRMSGRDKLQEAGRSLPSINEMSAEQQEMMDQATQCVKKFAPDGRQKMKQGDNGHITACKISDARPDEMIASWSGDHIYSFDLVRGNGQGNAGSITTPARAGKVKESCDRKRKRQGGGSTTSPSRDAAARASPKPRTQAASLRILYQNGQSEDIPIASSETPESLLTGHERRVKRIAKATIKIQSSIFGRATSSNPSSQFTTALSHAATTLTDMDEIIRDWRYPLDPTPDQVAGQLVRREGREASRRFVQAAGVLARALGGKLQTTSGHSPMMTKFAVIDSARSDRQFPRNEQFRYDFLKAIITWLESGAGQLVEAFTRPAEMSPTAKAAARLPIPESEASIEAIDDILIPYLLIMASNDPVMNVDVNQYEVDENRQVFPTEKAAVIAFASAVGTPFADLSSAITAAEGAESFHTQDRQVAHKFWARKVARGILLRASESIAFHTVDRAFGGHSGEVEGIAEEEDRLKRLLAGERDESDEAVQGIAVVAESGDVVREASIGGLSASAREGAELSSSHSQMDDIDVEMAGVGASDFEETALEVADHSSDEAEDVEDDEDDNDENDHDDDDDDDDEYGEESEASSQADEEDGVPNLGIPRYMLGAPFERYRMRPSVEKDTPCSGPIRRYVGHLNIKTVKDVNYFGPDDEYVVSGSDDGNFFIWDRKTSKLVNILEGDGEVVNVVQGHPYETMLAVSGIDHTIKIFSPDARAREIARAGTQGIVAHDASGFSSLAWPRRFGAPRRRERASQGSTDAESAEDGDTDAAMRGSDNEDVAANGLHSRKRWHHASQILENNEMDRTDRGSDNTFRLPHSHLLQLLLGNLGNAGLLQALQ